MLIGGNFCKGYALVSTYSLIYDRNQEDSYSKMLFFSRSSLSCGFFLFLKCLEWVEREFGLINQYKSNVASIRNIFELESEKKSKSS